MKLKTWKELEIGTINSDAGNSKEVKTGTFRMGLKPVFNPDACIQCYFCWEFCPDYAIIVEEVEEEKHGKKVKTMKVKGIDYYHCKGCGICVEECPKKGAALVMEKETVEL